MNYYNEWESFPADWLRNLCAAGEIPAGVVDSSDIRKVVADGLRGFPQCHFFAGLGGWPYALRLAGWPATRPVWTASCPCQPFSAAGKGKGEEDERHLWPHLFALVCQCRPLCLFGEQVGGRAGYEWLDGVRIDCESEGYTFGAADIPAASIGAPHIRSRLYWVALRHAAPLGVCHPEGSGRPVSQAGWIGQESGGSGGSGRLADADQRGLLGSDAHLPQREPRQALPGSAGASDAGGLGDASNEGQQGRSLRRCRRENELPASQAGSSSAWSRYRSIECRDGKSRRVPVEPEFFPLVARPGRADLEAFLAFLEQRGIDRETGKRLLRESGRNRVGVLKAAGNAIVAPLGAVFVKAVMAELGIEPEYRKDDADDR